MNSIEKSNRHYADAPHLSFVLAESTQLSVFFPLFQRGVIVKGNVGCSVRSFLMEEVGAGQETIEMIQSIFLDGSPVDDLDSAIIREGSRLALSAAMPGLVGATMRRGGAYSSFRRTITYRESGAECVSGVGSVRLKLFNLLLDELVPVLLGKGILVKSSDLDDFLRERAGELGRFCEKVLLDGAAVEADAPGLRGRLSGYEQVYLSAGHRGEKDLQ